MNNDKNIKNCPFCGEEIKSVAIKCKHCGEFLNNQNSENKIKDKGMNNSGKNIGVGCLYIFIFIFLLGVINSFLSGSEDLYSLDENIAKEYFREEVKGEHTGFGSLAVFSANLGGQVNNCLELGVGISLVEQIEDLFKNVSATNEPVFYSIKDYNPQLKFFITNPRWAGLIEYRPNACFANLEFDNIKNDTIVGYKGDKPYTIVEAICMIEYTVSEQSGKYKANIHNVGCQSNEGYR